MKTQSEIKNIIDNHSQKYSHSCSPSLAEMLLKLSDSVPIDYYEEQYRDKNEGVGLKNIDGKTIAGKKFFKFPDLRNRESLIKKIKEELEAGRFMGLYMRVSESEAHGFVIAWIEGNEIQLLSKYSENGAGEGSRTDAPKIPLALCHAIATDCIYYENSKE